MQLALLAIQFLPYVYASAVPQVPLSSIEIIQSPPNDYFPDLLEPRLLQFGVNEEPVCHSFFDPILYPDKRDR